MSAWKCMLEMGPDREVRRGNKEELARAVGRGADLRVRTEFWHNEHIDTLSPNHEKVEEVAEFRVTYLLEHRWAAGIMTLRQPVSLPDSFGPRSSMSFFVYNQDGSQGVARPYLDGKPALDTFGPTPMRDYNHTDMPKYHLQDVWDEGTNGPSRNFIYDFDVYQYFVRDDWREVLSHDGDGSVTAGSVDELAKAFNAGCEIKAGISRLCSDLSDGFGPSVPHEVFVHVGSGYYYTDQKLFIAGTHPLVRVKPAIPLLYGSRNWDFGWLLLRTDGACDQRIYNPYTLRCRDTQRRLAVRWFVR